ncbi:sensor histidine kinase [Ventrimonas sp. CLA-AP-H27]|uniref:Sensor histidine kinase n=1 Tax=Ventrimonas faecis TaxID=3133170 RepID=A0ABV1HJ61_9FIRM
MNIAKRVASRVSLKDRMRLLIMLTVIPLTVMVLGIVAMIYNYSSSYNRIMANLKVINTYNMNFKADMEYSMYRVMIGLINTKEFESGDILEGESQYATVVKNPFHMIEEARYDMEKRIARTSGSDGDISIKGILSCLDSLEKAVEKMVENSNKAGRYDESASIWENDVQGLCSMIQDYINKYIYYETRNMENLQRDLEIHTRQSVYAFMVLLTVILTTGIMFSAMLTNSVTRPISSLKMTAERLGNGDWNARAETGSLEEINVLARTFNQMSEEIAGLIERIRKEQKNLHIAEMKLLQAQINPHFLYNTLDSIVWMAEDGDNRKVVEMTSDLSDFFRTVLSGGSDFIPIEEEKRHIESYLKIQKIRYEDILDYRIVIEEQILHKRVLKMLLQPIVENALYHGIKNKRGGGTIVIRGYEDKSGLVFEVEDDGHGMDQATLSSLRDKVSGRNVTAEVSDKGGFGMSNVAQRIRMYYGTEASITIESEEQVGTCVKIYIGHGQPAGKQTV